jgi:DNA-binding transcriptional LysR family regulator
MELRHLRTIAAVARHGSFTKAAEELHLAQSAVSQQLRRLEDELGVTVFRRTSRSVELTAEGRLVLDHAHRVLAEVDGLRDELDELTGLVKGELRLGGLYPTGLYDLHAVIAGFHGQHPGVAIHFVEGTQDDLLGQLRLDELDAVFTAVDPDRIGEDLTATKLSEEEFVVALPVDHPLTARAEITLEELAGEALVAFRENSALRRRLETAMAEVGLEPRNAFVCTEIGAVRDLVSRGLGIAVMPRSHVEAAGPHVAWRPVGPSPLTWPVALVWRAGRRQPPASKAFLALALEADAAPRRALRAA